MFDNQLKRQAKLRETILAGVVMLVLTYAFYVNLYTPQKKKTEANVTRLTEILEKKAGLEKLIKALQVKYNQVQEEMKRQVRLMATEDPKMQLIKKYRHPVYKNVAEFLNAITQDDFRGTVDITTINYDPSVSKKGYDQTAFLINANGRFANVIEFIEKLEALPALISLDRLKIEVSKKDPTKVTLNLNGTFYRLESEHG